MADQLPSINFGFEDLRSRMNQFTARFDDFIEKGRRRVLEERNQFRMNVAEVQGMFYLMQGGSCKLRMASLLAVFFTSYFNHDLVANLFA